MAIGNVRLNFGGDVFFRPSSVSLTTPWFTRQLSSNLEYYQLGPASSRAT